MAHPPVSPQLPGLPSSRRRTLTFEITTADGVLKPLRFDKERIVLGSVVSADVRLSGEGVSPIHAVIEVPPNLPSGEAATPVIYDLASETGLFINGQKVVTRPLQEGDVLTLGRQQIRFKTEEASPRALPERVREAGGRRLYLGSEEELKPLLLEDEREVVEVFDYRPTHKPALEVVMSWFGTILDVEHFVGQPSVKLGTTQDCDFAIPQLLSQPRFELATLSSDGFKLRIAPEMKGVIQSQGALRELSSVGTEVAIGRNDFAKIAIGDLVFYVSHTAAPPRLKRRKLWERDALFARILSLSMVFTTAFLIAVWNTRVPQQVEAEQLPERIAMVLYQPPKVPSNLPRARATPRPPDETANDPAPPNKPPKPRNVKVEIQPKPEPTPKPVPKYMDTGSGKQVAKASGQNGARGTPISSKQGKGTGDEGEGARAKGTSGQRGQQSGPTAKDRDHTAHRPSAERGQGQGGGHSQVQGAGNVDFLKAAGGRIENILGSSTSQLSKAGDRLKGFGGFTTQGRGGLALSGSGKGGGGSSDLGQGLAEKGIGGGRVGTGAGAAGSGGIVGARARIPLRTGGLEEAVIMGAIDKDAIEAALLAHKDEFRLCYERELNAESPTISGRISVSFTIGPSGKTTQTGILSSTIGNANVDRCYLNVIKRIQFPIPRGGGIVEAHYPFKIGKVGS